MRINSKHISFTALLLVSAINGWCGISEGDLNKKADILYGRREYEMAYDYYLKLKALQPDKLLYEYRAGVCAIYNGSADYFTEHRITTIEKTDMIRFPAVFLFPVSVRVILRFPVQQH